MNESGTLPRSLDSEETACVLWLFDRPVNAEGMTTFSNTGYPFVSERNGDFHGAAYCRAIVTRTGLTVHLRVTLRYTGLPEIPQELLTGFSMIVVQEGRVIASAPFTINSAVRPVEANLTLQVKNLEELDGVWLIPTDVALYCWDHTHCAGCGRQAQNDEHTTWTCRLDPNPGDYPILFCSGACEPVYREYCTPHPVVHN